MADCYKGYHSFPKQHRNIEIFWARGWLVVVVARSGLSARPMEADAKTQVSPEICI